ncbi:hypothetical protein [Thermodesulforhabdus norvegica]|uniref:Uncharacterized protein n=1 Tax=Thermodesulforhabdus norvegica TaxID=39841 RepID=A0A1I4QWS0_9BACT|nr:hypothetical protein [Thermodesulforhabdus norvegica]SFM44451.1 hypothetical protein SAMN05660836_00264 [Thermodesulforhabdus norvegica]
MTDGAIRRGLIYSMGIFLLTVFSACGSGKLPDITSEKPPEGYTFSSAQVRRIMIDQPFLLSGDYFLKRDPEKESTNLIRIFADAGDKARAVRDQEERLARLEEAVFKRRLRAEQDIFATKVGFLVDRDRVKAPAAESFLRVADEETENRGAIFIGDRDIREVLSKTDCLERRDLACISRIVGIYPGVRMLNIVEVLDLPETFPANSVARVSIVDTGLSYRYPILEMTMPVKSQAEVNEFLRLLAAKIVDIAMEKKNIMPWYCRAFSEEGDGRWFISAGALSGLHEGDILNVIRSGRLVKAPTGTPAGWIPGDPKGMVQVERLVGEDLAIVSLVSGLPPDLEDFLIPQKKSEDTRE